MKKFNGYARALDLRSTPFNHFLRSSLRARVEVRVRHLNSNDTFLKRVPAPSSQSHENFSNDPQIQMIQHELGSRDVNRTDELRNWPGGGYKPHIRSAQLWLVGDKNIHRVILPVIRNALRQVMCRGKYRNIGAKGCCICRPRNRDGVPLENHGRGIISIHVLNEVMYPRTFDKFEVIPLGMRQLVNNLPSKFVHTTLPLLMRHEKDQWPVRSYFWSTFGATKIAFF